MPRNVASRTKPNARKANRRIKKKPPLANSTAVKKVNGNSRYRPEYADQVTKLCMLGLKEDELAEAFGVSANTITNWKNRYPSFLVAMRAGKVLADAEVAGSLYKNATGFTVEATKVFLDKETKTPIYAPYLEYHRPDAQAQRYWLNNRQRGLWRERSELTGADGEPLLQRLVQMTDAQRLQEAIALIGAARQRIEEARGAGVVIDVQGEEIEA